VKSEIEKAQSEMIDYANELMRFHERTYHKPDKPEYVTHHISMGFDKESGEIHVKHKPDKPDPECCCGIRGCDMPVHGQYLGVNFCEIHGYRFIPKEIWKFLIHGDPPTPAHEEAVLTTGSGKFGKYDSTGIGEPDPSLKAQVVQVLGADNIVKVGDNWVFDEGAVYTDIPAYPDDLVLAMGALEEYCRKTNSGFRICRWCDGTKEVRIFNGADTLIQSSADFFNPCFQRGLPEVICLAIVAHAKGSKS